MPARIDKAVGRVDGSRSFGNWPFASIRSIIIRFAGGALGRFGCEGAPRIFIHQPPASRSRCFSALDLGGEADTDRLLGLAASGRCQYGISSYSPLCVGESARCIRIGEPFSGPFFLSCALPSSAIRCRHSTDSGLRPSRSVVAYGMPVV